MRAFVPRTAAICAAALAVAAGPSRSGGLRDQDAGDPEGVEAAVRLHREAGDRAGEAEALRRLALLRRDGGDLARARILLDEAIALVEDARAGLLGPERRSACAAARRAAYELQTDVLMRLHRAEPLAGYDVLAFLTNERARGLSLMDILLDSGADLPTDLDPALGGKKRALQEQLERLERRRTGLRAERAEEAAAEVESELQRGLADYGALQAEIRAKSARYAGLTEPPPLTLGEIQQRILDPDTVLLAYALGPERSYLWSVGTRGFQSYELPGREALENAARKVHEGFSSPTAAAPAELRRTASELAGLLLGPLESELLAKRLVVVADGALQYVPFAALPWGPQGTPLIASHEVVSLPSVSTLAELRRESAFRSPAAGTLAVLADPVLDKDDARLAAPRRSRPRFQRQEAEGILALAEASSRLAALDFEASRDTAKGPDLGRYRIVHFATPGLLDNERPERSALVLSGVDRQGRGVEGRFSLPEIYALRLQADLVVLSACQTTLGSEVRAEGLTGLTRGFMYAGAPRVVATLWSVRDGSAAELMRRFYLGMLREDLPPAAALRRAQMTLLAQPAWQSPYHWAGFVLQGDWR